MIWNEPATIMMIPAKLIQPMAARLGSLIGPASGTRTRDGAGVPTLGSVAETSPIFLSTSR